MLEEHALAALIVSLVFVFVMAFLWFVTRYQRRDRELLHAERMAFLEKGLPLPPQFLPTPDPPPGEPGVSSENAALQTALGRLPANSLKTGLVAFGLGAGLVLAFLLARPPWGHWAWGLVLMLAGAAHLIYWRAAGREEWMAARAFEEQARRKLVGGPLDGPAGRDVA